MLLMRGLLVLVLLAITVAMFWFDREGLRDQLDGHISFTDVLYFTAVTLTSVGYGDIVPVSDSARIFDAIFVAPIRLLIWVVFLGTTYEFVLQKHIEIMRLKRMEKKLADHIIICGYGHGGRVAAQELLARGYTPEQLLVIEPDRVRIDSAVESGFICLHGDATSESLLMKARIHKAKAIIIAVAKDDIAAMVVLTVRSLKSKARLIARVDEEANGKLLREAGVDTIVPTARLGGSLLAGSVDENDNLSLITDMLSARGRVALVERLARPEEVGKLSNALPQCVVISLDRNEKTLRFTSEEPCVIEVGDLLTLIEQARVGR